MDGINQNGKNQLIKTIDENIKEVVRTSIEIWPTTDFDEIWCGHWGPLVKHNG